MEFKLETKKLVPVLKKIMKSSGTSLPVLHNLLVEGKNGRVFFTATDLECSLTINTEADIISEGKILIPELLMDYKFKSEKIHITAEENKIKIKSGSFKTILNSPPIEDYPILPKNEIAEGAKVKAEDLLAGLILTSPFMAKESYNNILQGVYLSVNEKKLSIVATDSYRLSEYQCEKTGCMESIVIPDKAIMFLIDVLRSNLTKEVTIQKIGENILIVGDNFSFRTTVRNGNFPDHKPIMQILHNTVITIDRKELLDQLKLNYSVVDNKRLKFLIKDHDLIISVEGIKGTGESKILIEHKEGSDIETILNIDYLINIFDLLKEEKCVIVLMDNLKPILIKQDNFQHIIMPLRS